METVMFNNEQIEFILSQYDKLRNDNNIQKISSRLIDSILINSLFNTNGSLFLGGINEGKKEIKAVIFWYRYLVVPVKEYNNRFIYNTEGVFLEYFEAFRERIHSSVKNNSISIDTINNCNNIAELLLNTVTESNTNNPQKNIVVNIDKTNYLFINTSHIYKPFDSLNFYALNLL